MNTELLYKLAQAKQQALQVERSGYKPPLTRWPSWIAHIGHWLGQAKAPRRTALNPASPQN